MPALILRYLTVSITGLVLVGCYKSDPPKANSATPGADSQGQRKPESPIDQLSKLYGGSKGLAVLQKPEKVEAYRLDHPRERGQKPTVKEGPVAVSQSVATELVSALSLPEAYGWEYAKACIPNWGVRLSIYRGPDRIDVLLCFECNILSVSLNGTTTDHEDFDPIRPQLVRSIKAIFPNDQELQNLSEN